MNLSQRNQLNAVSNRTSDPLVSPVTAQELADFIYADVDPVMDGLLLAACQEYINLTHNELLQRNYVMKFARPQEYSRSVGGISPVYAHVKDFLSLGVWPVDSITSMTADSDDVLADVDFDGAMKPARIYIEKFYRDIEVGYLAGYATSDEIPANALLGIKMMAAYLYEHRGSCSVTDASRQSGAYALWCSDAIMVTL